MRHDWQERGFSRYGAQMGRRDRGQPDEREVIRFHRVRLNTGGYDSGGAYWGIGSPLYHWYTDTASGYVRLDADGTFEITPIFVAVTDTMILTDHNGEEARER